MNKLLTEITEALLIYSSLSDNCPETYLVEFFLHSLDRITIIVNRNLNAIFSMQRGCGTECSYGALNIKYNAIMSIFAEKFPHTFYKAYHCLAIMPSWTSREVCPLLSPDGLPFVSCSGLPGMSLRAWPGSSASYSPGLSVTYIGPTSLLLDSQYLLLHISGFYA